MKESLSTEDIPQHDSSQESIEEVHHGHHHIHQNIIVNIPSILFVSVYESRKVIIIDILVVNKFYN